MKKLIFLATVILTPVIAYGQNVTLYGLVDSGVEYVNNVGPGGKSLVRMPTLTGSLPSRWGLRGAEDLGGGLSSVFVLEQGFAPPTGTLNQGGRMWGRQAYLGLSGKWGSLTLGRQYTMTFWALEDADIVGPNIYGLASIDPYLGNARADNIVAYRGTFDGLTIGATYSFGRDGTAPANCAGEEAGDSKACRQASAMIKYNATRWGVAVSFERLYGGPGGGAGLSKSSLTDQRAIVDGYIKFTQQFKVAGGLLRRKNEGAGRLGNSDLWFLGATYMIVPDVITDGVVYRYHVKDSNNNATMIALRASYLLSKRTLIYVTGGRIYNSGQSAISVSGGSPTGTAPPAGGAQTGVMLGTRHTF